MTQVDDLSRSLIAFEQNNTVVVVLELSQSSWLAAGVVPGKPPPAHAVLDHYAWRHHCRDLFQMPIAA